MDRFSRNTQATNWIEVAKKKMADNYFSDDEESEWLVNIHSSILDKPSEETQLHDSEISSFIETETATQQRRRKLTLMFGLAGATP